MLKTPNSDPPIYQTTLQKNLELLMEAFKINIHQLHRNTNVPLTTLKRMKADPQANPTLSSLVPIANFFSVTLNQLAGLDPLPTNIPTGVYIEKREYWISVPVLQWKDIASWPNNKEQLELNQFLSTDLPVSTASYALEIQEDDISGFLRGSYIIVDPEAKPQHKKFVIVGKNDMMSLKQALIHENEIYLKPLNDYLKTEKLTNEHQLKGVVMQIRMDAI